MPVVSKSRSCHVLGLVAAGGGSGLSGAPTIFCLASSSFVVAFDEACNP